MVGRRTHNTDLSHRPKVRNTFIGEKVWNNVIGNLAKVSILEFYEAKTKRENVKSHLRLTKSLLRGEVGASVFGAQGIAAENRKKHNCEQKREKLGRSTKNRDRHWQYIDTFSNRGECDGYCSLKILGRLKKQYWKQSLLSLSHFPFLILYY